VEKAERQRLVESIVGRRRIGSHEDLRAALAAAGCEVAQATLSRDLRELGIEKTLDGLGRPRYGPTRGSRRGDPGEALAAILGRYGRDVTAAQNVVVIRTEVGTAGAIARALDRAGHPLVVGTLAGDDTCLVIAADAAGAAELAAELG